MKDQASPDEIIRMGFGFWSARTLLSAVELGLFTALTDGECDLVVLRQRLGLSARAARDFLDALVALGLLERTDGRYRNTPVADHFLDRAKPTYVGGILEMAARRLYPFWGSLTEALRTGSPQNEAKHGRDFFATVYAEPEMLGEFLRAMTALSSGAARALADQFPWERYGTVIDVGAAEGGVPVQLALRHPHLTGGGFDLPPVGPHFDAYVAGFGLSPRLRFHPGDFWQDPIPGADVLILGHILHDWGIEQKLALLRAAYEALPDGGAVVAYDAIIDDERRSNAFGLLMSLNMLIETEAGFDYTGADCQGWMHKVGFQHSYVRHLAGPDSMVVGIK